MKQALSYSIASAAVAGVLFGAVLKLGPEAIAEYGGPQILISGSASRTAAVYEPSGGIAFAGYQGEIPDYVLGSDWTQTPEYLLASDIYAYPEDASAYAPEPEPQAEDAAFVAPVKVSSPPPVKPVSYPSLDGDILGGETRESRALAEVVEAQEDPQHLPS